MSQIPEQTPENTVNEEAMVEYNFEQLMKDGVAVTREDISRILDLEMDFLAKTGHAIPVDEIE